MSIRQTKHAACPVCHKEFEVSAWDSLNGDLDPEAKEQLIYGHLFDYTCPHCQAKGGLDYPLLYHDMTNHLMVQYNSDAHELEELIKNLLNGPDIVKEYMASQGYRIRAVTSRRALSEKATIFDAGFDDCTIEIVKIIYAVMQETQDPTINFNDILFINEATHGPSLYFVCENSNDDFAVPISNEIYQDIAKTVDLLPEEERQKTVIDTDWATRVMRTYEVLK